MTGLAPTCVAGKGFQIPGSAYLAGPLWAVPVRAAKGPFRGLCPALGAHHKTRDREFPFHRPNQFRPAHRAPVGDRTRFR